MNSRSDLADLLVLGTLCACVLLGGAGLTLLAVFGVPIPSGLCALVTGAGGVLAGWFGRRQASGAPARNDAPGSH